MTQNIAILPLENASSETQPSPAEKKVGKYWKGSVATEIKMPKLLEITIVTDKHIEWIRRFFFSIREERM